VLHLPRPKVAHVLALVGDTHLAASAGLCEAVGERDPRRRGDDRLRQERSGERNRRSIVTTTTETIRRRLERQYVVIRVPEELDISTAPGLGQRLIDVGANTDVVVDLRDLRFCGAQGITTLLDAGRHLVALGSSLTLSGPPPSFDRLLRLCRLDDHFVVRRPIRRRSHGGGADPNRR
jgi:anti-anti-sigma factor